MKRAPIKMDIPRVIRMLEGRLKNAEGTQRFMISVQISQLEKAEKLRRLALAATTALGTVIGDGSAKVRALDSFARQLQPFSKPARQLEKMRKALR